jgi:accessory gene regulator protein AgrB
MRILWLILSLIPAPFFFHSYEYGQHIKGEEASFLFISSVLFVVIIGFLSSYIKIGYVILVNIITGLLSIFLAMYFIPNDGWFKPVGRDVAVIFVAVVLLIGQLIIRGVSRTILIKKE